MPLPRHRLPLALALACLAGTASASDFPRLDQALPSGANISAFHPVFDFDGDGCLLRTEILFGLKPFVMLFTNFLKVFSPLFRVDIEFGQSVRSLTNWDYGSINQRNADDNKWNSNAKWRNHTCQE